MVDDCYNANPASMDGGAGHARARWRPGGRAVAVLGDMLELGARRGAGARARWASGAAQVRSWWRFFGPALGAAGPRRRPRWAIAAAHFTEVEPLVAWLKPRLRPGDVVLVKGSRGMRLERVVEALTGRAAPGEAH